MAGVIHGGRGGGGLVLDLDVALDSEAGFAGAALAAFAGSTRVSGCSQVVCLENASQRRVSGERAPLCRPR